MFAKHVQAMHLQQQRRLHRVAPALLGAAAIGNHGESVFLCEAKNRRDLVAVGRSDGDGAAQAPYVSAPVIAARGAVMSCVM